MRWSRIFRESEGQGCRQKAIRHCARNVISVVTEEGVLVSDRASRRCGVE